MRPFTDIEAVISTWKVENELLYWYVMHTLTEQGSLSLKLSLLFAFGLVQCSTSVQGILDFGSALKLNIVMRSKNF